MTPLPINLRRNQIINRDDYVTLPKDLALSYGTLYEDFEDDANWTPSASAVVADNSTNYKTGAQSVKLTGVAGVQSSMTKTVNWDLSGNWNLLTFWFYLHDPIADYGTSSMLCYLSNNAGVTDAFRFWITIGTGRQNASGGRWFKASCHKNDFAVVGAGTFASPIIRLQFRFTSSALKTPSISFDSLYIDEKRIPALVLSFDDASSLQYSNCYQYMKNFNIRGTAWAIGDNVGITNYMTAAQIKELAREGWCIGNHCDTGTNLTTLTEAQQETAINDCKTVLEGIGLSGGENYLCYPGGTYNADTEIALVNCGIIFGRTTQTTLGTSSQHVTLPFSDIKYFTSQSSSGASLATLNGWVDSAVNYQYVLSVHLHLVGGSDISVAIFQSWIQYIRSYCLMGKLYVITVDDLYKLTTGPVKVLKVK